MIWGKQLPLSRLIGISLTVAMLGACEVNLDHSGSSEDGGGDGGTSGDAGNNGVTNNGVTNNGVTNNGVTNNGVTNNGVTNNGVTNNGTPNLCVENERVEGGICVPCEPGTFSGAGAGPEGDDTMCEVILCVADQRVEANACVDCDPGTTSDPGADATGADTVCDAVICDVDERVVGNACEACPAGTSNDAGDDASGADTVCDAVICAVNERVESNACVACGLGQINLPGDDASGTDTMCDGLLCPSNQYVSGNVCTDCPAGTTNTAGDDASGADTTCDATTCAEDEYVSSNNCLTCPTGQTNAAGDDASGADTMCETVLCEQDQYVSSNTCVACPAGTTNAAGDDPTGADTTCVDACAVALGVSCVEFEEAYIKASNTDADDTFGFSVALSGNTLVVGAPGESSDGTGVNGTQSSNNLTSSGAAYVFTRTGSTWTQQAYLKASTPRVGNQFGQAVAVSGDTVAVGAPFSGTVAGGDVHVFTRNGTIWTEQAAIAAPSPALLGQFGSSLDLDGDLLAVGDREGFAYVFARTTTVWSLEQQFSSPFRSKGAGFGQAVALSGNTLVVGAPTENAASLGSMSLETDMSAMHAGAAYVYVRSGTTWTREAYLKANRSASDPGAGDNFGQSVAISGDTVAIGAPGEGSDADGIDGDFENSAANGSGAVYVFTRTGATWSQQAYVKASNSDQFDRFGGAVALDGDRLVVGASQESSDATGVNGDEASNMTFRSGAVYLFNRTGGAWAQDAYIKAGVVDSDDNFGVSVALDANTLAVGAELEDSSATGVNGDATDNTAADSGAAYIRRIAP